MDNNTDKIRLCLYCLEPIAKHRTRRAIFCDATCRVRYWKAIRGIEREARRASYPSEANTWADTHPDAYGKLVYLCFDFHEKEYRYATIALIVEEARCRYDIHIRNALRRYIRERIKRDYPVFENWLR